MFTKKIMLALLAASSVVAVVPSYAQGLPPQLVQYIQSQCERAVRNRIQREPAFAQVAARAWETCVVALSKKALSEGGGGGGGGYSRGGGGDGGGYSRGGGGGNSAASNQACYNRCQTVNFSCSNALRFYG